MTQPAFVMVTTSYPMAGDGREAAGSFVADLAEEIARSMPVRVVAPGTESRVEGSDTLRIYRYRAPAKPLSTLKPWNLGDLASLLSVHSGGSEAVETAVAAGPVARLLALWALPSGQWARRAACRHGIPYSIWTLGSDVWSLGKIPVVRNLLAKVLAQADTCYSDGLQLAEDTRRIGGREVAFLPSTRRIDLDRQVPVRSSPPYRLLFLGRWHSNKGIDLLLQALELLAENDWARIESVSICGGGPMQEEVFREVERLQRAGRPVTRRGYLNKAEAEAAIASADYLLIPSRIESIPVVFSDAMKLACPVISMPVGDLPALIDGYDVGWVAKSVSAHAYAIAITEALAEVPATRTGSLQRCAETFDLAAIAHNLMSSGGNADLRDRPK